MNKLSATPNKDELIANMGQVCKLGRNIVKVSKTDIRTRSGSYEKGFKFHTTTYIVLRKDFDKSVSSVSFDYGKTWNHYSDAAAKSAGRSKIMLSRETQKEFAYDSIQRINAQYYGY